MAEVSSPYELCTLAEGPDSEEHVIVTYWVQASTQTDILAKAVALAVEQSSGTWTDVPYETVELKTRYAAKVVGIYGFEAAKRSEELQMALDKWGIYSETDFARLYTIES